MAASLRWGQGDRTLGFRECARLVCRAFCCSCVAPGQQDIGDRKMAGPRRKQDRGPIFRLELRKEQTSSLSCERMRNIRDTLQRALSACETRLLLAMKCAKGSLADLLGSMKRRPLHP